MRDDRGRGLRILIVAEDTGMRESLADRLREDGHDARAAGGGGEALHALATEARDLALIDLEMAGEDALDLQRRLRDAAPATAVLVLCASASTEAARRALKDGAYDCVTKPPDLEHLAHRLRNLAERLALVRENRDLKERQAAATGAGGEAGEGGASGEERTLSAVERAHIARVLRESGWNISHAARVLDVDRTTVYNKIRQYRLAKGGS